MTYQTTYLKDYQAPNFSVQSLELTFEINNVFTQVTAISLIKPLNNHINLELFGEDLELVSIAINKKLLSDTEYQIIENGMRIIDIPNEIFELTCVTKIYPEKNLQLMGLFKTKSMLCTQCEPEGFRRMTYFFDRPDVMTSYTCKIIADKKQYPVLLANGNLMTKGDLENNLHYAVWQDPFKKPCYLFALVAGDLANISDTFITQSGREVKLEVYVEHGQEQKAKHAMQSLKDSMAWDEKAFGREYDLDIYMIVAASDFNMGAMENKGLNIFNAKYVLADITTATDDDYKMIASVIAHEYCHNWSGNRVTCRDWFQLSLKEGLTIFRDQSFSADLYSPLVKRIQDVRTLKTYQFAEDAGPMAHSVQPDAYMEINNFYTHTIYEKGAEVIRMLKTILGDKTFHLGMDKYFHDNDGKAVTIHEFVQAMQDVSDRDLTQFKRWYKQIGTPTITVKSIYDSNQKTLILTLTQSCEKTKDLQNNPLVIPIRIELLTQSGELISLNEDMIQQDVLLLDKITNTFVFSNINQKPILVLNKNFSAPVYVNYEYNSQDLETIAQFSSDGYARYEAIQRSFIDLFKNIKKEPNENHDESLNQFVNLIKSIIIQKNIDKAFLCELLNFPSEKYLMNLEDQIDIDSIHQARKMIIKTLAQGLRDEFLNLYTENQYADPTSLNQENQAKRQLKNISLYYLSLIESYKMLSKKQYDEAHTMTEKFFALQCLVNLNGEYGEAAIEDFYQHFANDDLVIDKWFSAQALAQHDKVFENVQALTKHPAFSIKNPNRLRSLVAVFSSANPYYFHREDSKGYQFLTNYILELDKINPQMAVRLFEPLLLWEKFSGVRGTLMKKQLERIHATANLSNDLQEVVSKSLKIN